MMNKNRRTHYQHHQHQQTTHTHIGTMSQESLLNVSWPLRAASMPCFQTDYQPFQSGTEDELDTASLIKGGTVAAVRTRLNNITSSGANELMTDSSDNGPLQWALHHLIYVTNAPTDTEEDAIFVLDENQLESINDIIELLLQHGADHNIGTAMTSVRVSVDHHEYIQNSYCFGNLHASDALRDDLSGRREILQTLKDGFWHKKFPKFLIKFIAKHPIFAKFIKKTTGLGEFFITLCKNSSKETGTRGTLLPGGGLGSNEALPGALQSNSLNNPEQTAAASDDQIGNTPHPFRARQCQLQVYTIKQATTLYFECVLLTVQSHQPTHLLGRNQASATRCYLPSLPHQHAARYALEQGTAPDAEHPHEIKTHKQPRQASIHTSDHRVFGGVSYDAGKASLIRVPHTTRYGVLKKHTRLTANDNLTTHPNQLTQN